MVNKRNVLIVVFVVISTIILGIISKSFAVERPKVVVVLKGSSEQYWKIVKAGAEKGFKDFGIDGEVISPKEETAEEQAKILEKIYKQKPDAVIVAPVDSSITPILDRFTQAKNIPVFLLDSDIPLKNKKSYIGTDNLDLGKKAGSLLASQLQPGDKVAIFGGDLSVSVFRERIKGAKITLTNAGINIAVEKLGLPQDDKSVQKVMTNVLRQYPDIKGVVATHDIVALQVIKALKEQGLNLPVIGSDGIIDMLELIENETLTSTVAQNPYDMGYLSIETVIKASNGKSIEKFVDSGVDIIIKENAKERIDFLNNILK